MPSPWSTARNLASLVKLSHTIFGLPFTIVAAALADHRLGEAGQVGLDAQRLGWIVLAFTAARTVAMAFNRIVDRRIDAENPRTAGRELPRGTLSLPAAWALTGGAAGLFLLSAWALGPLPLALAGPCLLIICVYSLFKRFSWSSHLALGVALSLAPGGAWIAVTGHFVDIELPLLLMLAVATWVAGFDILYSLQDVQFDRRHGLHSIPARFGTRGSLLISALLHVATVGSLLALHALAELGPAHLAGIGLVGAILVYEHWIVRPSDLSRIDKAFFDLNGYVSLAYLACTILDLWVL